MRRLFDIDIKDYEAGYNVYRRPSARGIILQGDRIALVYSGREHYYKFPGGGIQGADETIETFDEASDFMWDDVMG